MKSQLIESRRFIECDCYRQDHIMVVDILEEDEQPDGASKIFLADVAFLSNYTAPWYKRIWYALCYIFNKKSYYVSDSVCISERNIDQFEELVARLKAQREKLVKAGIVS
jgi:hypothetical protein